MKSFYESKETWKTEVDYLRCSPNFYNHPRYDCVLVQSEDGPFFARFVRIFAIYVDEAVYPIAQVHLLKRQKGNTAEIKKKDKDLRFLRLRQLAQTRFIWARSIIRGVLIFPAFDIEQDSIVFDIIDPDMAMRINEILLTG